MLRVASVWKCTCYSCHCRLLKFLAVFAVGSSVWRISGSSKSYFQSVWAIRFASSPSRCFSRARVRPRLFGLPQLFSGSVLLREWLLYYFFYYSPLFSFFFFHQIILFYNYSLLFLLFLLLLWLSLFNGDGHARVGTVLLRRPVRTASFNAHRLGSWRKLWQKAGWQLWGVVHAMYKKLLQT